MIGRFSTLAGACGMRMPVASACTRPGVLFDVVFILFLPHVGIRAFATTVTECARQFSA